MERVQVRMASQQSFFKFFWIDLGDVLLRSINYGYNIGQLSTTQREGVITCLPKGDKDKQYLKNWRPISLLNVTYKLASSCIANRLKSKLNILINEDQTGFVSGLFMGENIRCLYDVLQFTETNNIPGLLMLIDFQKAFDSISWPFIQKVFRFFNFGDSIIQWINTFYNNIIACIIVNGQVSEWFNILRGCRQGDPSSPYIFILCAEILALLIRSNKDIKGITIDGTEYLIAQYADDTSLTLDGTEKSLKTCLTVLEFFEISGLCINKDKTQVIWFGSRKNSDVTLCNEHKLSWVKGQFKILGITFSLNLHEMVKINYDGKIREIKSLLIRWSKRVLTPYGTITVIKSLALSKLSHLFLMLPNPDNKTIKELEKLFFNYLWNGTDRIKRDVISQSYKDGGLNMINLHNFMNAMKITWVRRFLTSSSKWIHIVNSTIAGWSDFTLYGAEYIKSLNTDENTFWSDTCLALYKLLSLCTPSTWEDF